MKPTRLFTAALLLGVLLVPSLAEARHHRHARLYFGLPYPISFMHNYGPGALPGTYAFYDGPVSVKCRQSAAAYIGADRRRHPCN